MSTTLSTPYAPPRPPGARRVCRPRQGAPHAPAGGRPRGHPGDRDAATDRLRLRWRRHPTPPADLTDAARAWRTGLPALGRLELDVDHHPRSLTIAETRVGASDFRAPDWDLPATEPGVLVQSLRLAVARGRFDFAIVPLACVSLHGLGRRLQRGSPREAVLLAELLALGRLATEMDAGPGAEFAMPAGGGR